MTQIENDNEVKILSTDKAIKAVRKDGSYRIDGKPVKGLYLRVSDHGHNKYWFKRYRYHGKRHDISFGSYPTVGLADAVAKAMAAECELFDGDDPLETRAEQQRERRRVTQKNKTFKVIADDLIKVRSELSAKGEKWKPRTKKDAENIVNGPLAPLHKFLCSEITARQIFDLVNPMRADTPSMADHVLKRIQTIFDWAYANDAMDGKANPSAMEGELGKLFGGVKNIEPDHEPRQGIDWRKLPALMTKLNQLAQPRTRYNVIEAATAIEVSVSVIYNAIGENKIKLYRPESISGGHNKIEIEPDDLFRFQKKVVDVIPGLPPVSVFVLEFLILNWLRFDEVRHMVWPEWQREETCWSSRGSA